MEKAEIIVIGDELLIGQVTDTNSGFIARELNSLGINILQTTVVHDDAEQIRRVIRDAFTRVSLVLTTGGLGPTKDDITKTTLCELFETELVKSEEVEKHVRQLYKNRPQVLNRLTETQWLVPRDCTVLENRVGSAPLMWFEKDGKILISMPGVPHEMEIGMREQVMPRLKQLKQDTQIIHHTLLVGGIPESSLAILIEQWETSLPKTMHLAYLPHNRKIRLRLTGMSKVGEPLEAEMQERLAELKKLVAPYLLADEIELGNVE